MKRIYVENRKTAMTDFMFVEGYRLKRVPFPPFNINIYYRESPFTDLDIFKMSFLYLENDCFHYSWGKIGLGL